MLLAAAACAGDRTGPPPPLGPSSAPSIEVGANVRTRAGEPVTIAAAIADSGGSSAGPWTYTLSWGDGASTTDSIATAGTAGATHTYAAEGSYVVRAQATNRAGGRGVDSLSVTVDPAIVIAGAGDIGACGLPFAAATADLLDAIPGTVFTLGDNAYPDGSAADFANCYDPFWGRHKARTRPTAGNHEYNTPGAAAYFAYFGSAAGDPTTGYYSYDLGDWHLIVLNSNIGMAAGSTQESWLRSDLQAHPSRCTLAMWHHALFSSGTNHASGLASLPLFQALYAAGAELVLVGHEHNYERFAPQSPTGTLDVSGGIREFVVGTGGAPLYAFGTVAANSEARSMVDHGVLRLTLRSSSYAWEFRATGGSAFTDSGSGTCH